MECYACKANSGEKRISPGETIHEGKYWLVEHAYPVALKGWLVLVLKRHVESLHELSKEEFMELAELTDRATKILYQELKCEKEYLMCLAETKHFYHIHFHLVAKQKNIRKNQRGTKIFTLLKVDEKDAVPKAEIIDFCQKLKEQFEKFK